MNIMYDPGIERVYLPLRKVGDTPFELPGDEVGFILRTI